MTRSQYYVMMHNIVDGQLTWNRIIIVNLIVDKLVANKFSDFYGTRISLPCSKVTVTGH
jgi:hypothetical protein